MGMNESTWRSRMRCPDSLECRGEESKPTADEHGLSHRNEVKAELTLTGFPRKIAAWARSTSTATRQE
jgi:hypothetical protein